MISIVTIFIGLYSMSICELLYKFEDICRFILLYKIAGIMIKCIFLFSIIGSLDLNLTKYENITNNPPTKIRNRIIAYHEDKFSLIVIDTMVAIIIMVILNLIGLLYLNIDHIMVVIISRTKNIIVI